MSKAAAKPRANPASGVKRKRASHDFDGDGSDASPRSAKLAKATKSQSTIDPLVAKESARLKLLAYDRGLLSSINTNTDTDLLSRSQRPLPSVLLQRTHADITVKAQSRTHSRFVILLPGHFHLLPSSKSRQPKSVATDTATDTSTSKGTLVGSLAKLDSANPILYLNFDSGNGVSGRLKLFGSIVYPKSMQLLALQYKSQRTKKDKPLECKGTFDHLFVFADYCWIGSKEENPDEKPLPMPAELQNPPIDVSLIDQHGWAGSEPIFMNDNDTENNDAGSDSDDDAPILLSENSDKDEPPRAIKKKKTVARKVASTGSAGENKPRTLQAKKRRTVDSDEEEEEKDADEGEDDSRASPSPSSSPVPDARPRRTSRREIRYDVDLVSSSSGGEDDEEPLNGELDGDSDSGSEGENNVEPNDSDGSVQLISDDVD